MKELARKPRDFHEKSKAQLANFTKERVDVKIMLSKYDTDKFNTKINLFDIVQIQSKPSAVSWPDTLHSPHSADVELFSHSLSVLLTAVNGGLRMGGLDDIQYCSYVSY